MRVKFVLPASAIVILVSFYFINGAQLRQQKPQDTQRGQPLPKDPMSGRIVFEQKGCIDCHSINGYGGKTAADFGTENFFGSSYDLISKMWNHSPEMLKQMNLKNIEKQDLSEEDFRNLSYFLNFLRYLGTGGNVSNGQKLFTRMKCSECHSAGNKNSGKISLNKIGVYASPLYLAQTMWNHAAKMQRTQKMSGVKIPMFKDNEFADLSAYIESLTGYDRREKVYMTPGIPLKGEKLFKSAKCFYCHVEKHIGPDLTKSDFNKSVSQIAGVMWNHASDMNAAMARYKISYPEFKAGEMADLISYLYFMNQNQVTGTEEEGRKLISEKGCVSCHSKGNPYNAPAAAAIGRFYDPDSFFSDLWNHLPMMEKASYAKGKSLPKLLPSEVKSLYLYFNRKVR